MSFASIALDVTIGGLHTGVAGVVPDVFPRPEFHIFGDACVAQPMDRSRAQFRGVLLEPVLFHSLVGGVETLLNEGADVARARYGPCPQILGYQWVVVVGRGQGGEA